MTFKIKEQNNFVMLLPESTRFLLGIVRLTFSGPSFYQ